MSAYVRVRKLDDLVQRIDHTGTQVDVAAAAGLSTQRVNQLYTGAHSIIEVRKARRLEDALGVLHGTLFTAVDATLLAPYITAEEPDGRTPGAVPSNQATEPYAPAQTEAPAPLSGTPGVVVVDAAPAA